MKKNLIKLLCVAVGAAGLVSCGEQPTTPDESKDVVSESSTPVSSSTSESSSEPIESTTKEIPTSSISVPTTSVTEKDYSCQVVVSSTDSSIKVTVSELSADLINEGCYSVVLMKDDKIISSKTNNFDVLETEFNSLDEGTYLVFIYAGEVEKEIFVASKEVTITSLKTFDLVLEDQSFDYDGKEHELLVKGEIPEGCKVTYKNNIQTNAGKYEVSALVEGEGYLTKELKANLEIKKINQVLEEKYPDELKVGEKVDYSSNLYFTVKYNGLEIKSILNEESKKYIASITLVADAKEIIIKSEGDQNHNGLDLVKEIDLAKLNFENLVFEDLTVTYDGLAHDIELKEVPEGATVTYTNNGQVDSGEYLISVEISKEGYNTKTLTAKLIISKVDVDVTIPEVKESYLYGEKVKYSSLVPFKVVYNGINHDAVLEDGNYVYELVFDSKGELEVSVIVEEGKNTNKFEKTNKYLVNLKEFDSSIQFSSEKFVYDGEEKTIELINLPQGVKVTYSNNSAKNAGEYDVSAVIEMEGYETKTITSKLVIEKASVEIYSDSNNNKGKYGGEYKYYSKNMFSAYIDDTEFKAEKADDGLFYATVKLIKAGEYEIIARCEETQNHLACEEKFSVKISQATFKPDAAIFDNDGNSLSSKEISNSTTSKPSKLKTTYSKDGYEVLVSGLYSFDISLNDQIIANSQLNSETNLYEARFKVSDVCDVIYNVLGTNPNVKPFNGRFEVVIEGIKQKNVSSNLNSSIEYSEDGYELVLSRNAEEGNQFSVTDSTNTYDAILDEETNTYNVKLNIKDAAIYTYIITAKEGNGYSKFNQNISITINKKQANIEILNANDFVYDGTKHTLTYKSNVCLDIFVNEEKVQGALEENLYVYTFDMLNANKYEVIVIKNDNYTYPEDYKDLTIECAKSKEKINVTLDNESTYTIGYDEKDHIVKFNAIYPFIVFDEDLNEFKSTLQDNNYVVEIVVKDAKNYVFTYEFENLDNFEEKTEDVRIIILKEAKPEFSYSIENTGTLNLDYQKEGYDITISEAKKKDFKVELISSISDETKTFESKDGSLSIKLVDSAEYLVTVKCGEYIEEKTYIINPINLAYTIYSYEEVEGQIKEVEYKGEATKNNDFKVVSNAKFSILDKEATYQENSGMYELKLQVLKTETIDIISKDINYKDQTATFNIILPELKVQVYTVSLDEEGKKVYTPYDGNETEIHDFEIRSEHLFKIGDAEAVLNEDTKLYVLSYSLKKTAEIEIKSLDEYFADTKVTLSIVKVVETTASKDWSDAKYSKNDTYILSDESKVIVKVTQPQTSTTAGNGISVGSSSNKGSITMNFTDSEGNKKVVKKLIVVLARWPKKTSYCLVNGFEVKIESDNQEFSFDINSDVIKFESSKQKDYRFHVKSIIVEWE